MNDTAPYASKSSQSLGRLFGTGPSPTRSEFQRDRDRIIHSTAFRRLQHKTQVFLAHEGRHFRNRLTHTLEVSQIARSIARALRLDEDLAEAVALSHDLGHTPFGHAGERALHRAMTPFGGFDHNVQALRVVTRLENRYAEHDGLNLTWETLEGILKHNGPLLDAQGCPHGRYAEGGLPGGLDDIPAAADLRLDTFASLEAQVAAIADDIAYNAHDIDDALRAGLVTLPDFIGVPMAGPIVSEVLGHYPTIAPKRQAHEVQRRLITRAVEDVIATSTANIAAAAPVSTEDVRLAGRALVTFSPATEAAEKGLKAFLFARVYRHEAVMVPVRESEAVVERLFAAYMANADMPGRWGEMGRPVEGAARARIIADFIAGMTDPYALDEHQRLFDARPDFR
ncbi:deoxyguanosinetriphosphate triphosphohydrolase [Devosia sp. XJ19-1]|uniref:Deoxyguanosinetriphosphate triphosphohydrolase-like protein n=1 Tax=Devosia ureilytica TaxID=2952754 RepID=A0A9Q4ALE1_9HYPH|nr:deoxyguanosinetriphosphate triphosphohydrolase [Devosia ureilytica]MCP8882125.1 deoxyguanosinetriphosphate triphosphohydrolase [Devosia ureilytica]MCP8885989.1 deoxyguanosinetriphosphate triphosphohydrolase [Devosia ureilytica]